jgi:hypothetical protein
MGMKLSGGGGGGGGLVVWLMDLLIKSGHI